VEGVLQKQLVLAGKWRALQVREQLIPAVKQSLELSALTPSLQAYDTLLQGEVTHVR
jgi:hypothetical protein